MPRSRGRKKASRGKAWRTGREGSSYDDSASSSEFGEVDGVDLDLLARSLAADDDVVRYADDKLGGRLLSRGWVAVHTYVDDLSDMWVWPPSKPDAEDWVPTMVTVQEEGYIMQSVDWGERQVDHAVFYETRAELLDDIESIEAYRHPSDPRQ